MDNKFTVSASPHFRIGFDNSKVMWLVNIALLPSAVASVYLFGMKSLAVMLISVITAIVTEVLSQLIFKREITIKDGSAVVTGLLLAFNLPSGSPWWMVVLGSFLAIFLVKQLFGGLGYNIFNPALASRALLLSSFPVLMTSWTKPVLSFLGNDAVSAASPLNIVKMNLTVPKPSYMDLFLGNVPGSLGETCKLALIIGGIILIIFKVVDIEIPVFFIGTVFALSYIFKRDGIYEILSGGLILGAIFMATDMVTAPLTRSGKIIFAVGCGSLTALIRNYGGFPEGVCYSILFMNCVVPIIDKITIPKKYGFVKSKATGGAK